MERHGGTELPCRAAHVHYDAKRTQWISGKSFTHPGGRNEAKPVSSQSRPKVSGVPGLDLPRLRIGAAAGDPDSRMEAEQ
jgi:hypothetical protein